MAVTLSSALLSACVTAPSPGKEEGVTPPRLVMVDKSLTWDNVRAFGPVPASLTAFAEGVCSTLNNKDVQFTATGYHSRAQNLDGKTLEKGGVYCVRK